MSIQSREEYTVKMRARYRLLRGKSAKTKHLDEFCAMTGYERKYGLKLLGGKREGPHATRPRKTNASYGPEVLEVLKIIWLNSEQLCGKRLKMAVALWLPFYEKRHGELTSEVRAKVLKISAAQIDRLLAPAKAQVRRRGNTTTKPGGLLKRQIPVRTHFERLSGPGWLEADTVAHGGDSSSGDFIYSLVLTDVYSGWTEMRAVWNKGQGGVLAALAELEAGLPFAIQGFDCDNGSEFLNYALMAYWAAEHGGPEGQKQRRPFKINFTRSRPYRKNDNAHVEQKNWTHVRQLLGYGRLDDPGLLEPINALYAREWMHLHNFFCPSFKLISKERVGSTYKKTYDLPQTPYQRLLASGQLNAKDRRHLERVYAKLDPFKLHQGIEKHLRKILTSNH